MIKENFKKCRICEYISRAFSFDDCRRVDKCTLTGNLVDVNDKCHEYDVNLSKERVREMKEKEILNRLSIDKYK